jgi:hypothetical protein
MKQSDSTGRRARLEDIVVVEEVLIGRYSLHTNRSFPWPRPFIRALAPGLQQSQHRRHAKRTQSSFHEPHCLSRPPRGPGKSVTHRRLHSTAMRHRISPPIHNLQKQSNLRCGQKNGASSQNCLRCVTRSESRPRLETRPTHFGRLRNLTPHPQWPSNPRPP